MDDITTVSESYDTVCGLKNLCAFRQQKSIYYYEEELSVPQERAVLCKDTLDQLITAIELNEQERIGSEIDDLFAEMQQRGVHDKDINLNLNYLLFRLMHLASNLDNEANQKEMLQFISAQSFREGISRGADSICSALHASMQTTFPFCEKISPSIFWILSTRKFRNTTRKT